MRCSVCNHSVCNHSAFVGPSTIGACAEAGANMIVSGSALMRSDDPRSVIVQMRNSVDAVIQKNSLNR